MSRYKRLDMEIYITGVSINYIKTPERMVEGEEV